MTEECEITGFSHQQQQRWPLVHQYLCGQLELPEEPNWMMNQSLNFRKIWKRSLRAKLQASLSSRKETASMSISKEQWRED